MSKSKKAPRIVTPVGILAFPYLTRPDTKYHALGEWKTKILFDPKDEAVKTFIDKLTEYRDGFVKEAIAQDKKLKAFTVKPVVEQHFDKEGEDTGLVALAANQKAVVESATKGRLEFNIVIVDAKKQVWGKTPIYGGTKAKLSIDLDLGIDTKAKTLGLRRRLYGVQVIDLVTGSGPSAESAGFDEEDGYAVPEVDANDGGTDENEQF